MRKFNGFEVALKLFLIESLCVPMYGLEIFMNTSSYQGTLYKLGVAYNFGLRRILGFPKRLSNHYARGMLGRFTFEHSMNLRTMKFLIRFSTCKSPGSVMYKTYFLNSSEFPEYVLSRFLQKMCNWSKTFNCMKR